MSEIEEIKARYPNNCKSYPVVECHILGQQSYKDIQFLLVSLESEDNEIKMLEKLRDDLQEQIVKLQISLEKEKERTNELQEKYLNLEETNKYLRKEIVELKEEIKRLESIIIEIKDDTSIGKLIVEVEDESGD